jgi:3-deoxy-7-phosphoheptulonate synthase
LRGGNNGPNYSKEHVKKFVEQHKKKNLNAGIVIDASHGNSLKDYKRQPLVIADIAAQIAAGEKKIAGVMVEANLMEGNQKIPATAPEGQNMLSQLRYGVSVTDGCVSWTTTAEIMKTLSDAVQQRRKLLKK